MATKTKMSEIRFTSYALQQLRERDLREALVRDALRVPDQVLSGKRGRNIAHKRLTIRGKPCL